MLVQFRHLPPLVLLIARGEWPQDSLPHLGGRSLVRGFDTIVDAARKNARATRPLLRRGAPFIF